MATQTPSSRGYAWAKQTNYQTQIGVGVGAFKEIVCMDQNFVDYEANTNNDEDWSHPGINAPTDEWVESHATGVTHTMPGFAQQMGEAFYINMGNYAVATPSGGTLSRDHTFKPTDPTVTRQDPAVTYLEKVGDAWNIAAPSMVGTGFSLKGSGMGLLTLDVPLVGSGMIDFGSLATFYPTGTPSVTRRTGQHKLFNSQIGLVAVDSGGTTTYGCRYRSFEFNYRKTMLDEAGWAPGCARFLVFGDPTSGAVRSAHEFDKQTADFSFEVDLAAGSPEAVAVQQQKVEAITLTATGGIIEAAIPYKLVLNVPVSKYTMAKPAVSGGMMRFNVSGRALFDFTTNKLFSIVLTNNIATYASAF